MIRTAGTLKSRLVYWLLAFLVTAALLGACSTDEPEPAADPTAIPTAAPAATPTATSPPTDSADPTPTPPLASTPTPLPSVGVAIDYPIRCPQSGGHLIMGNAKEITNPTPFTQSSVDHYIKAASMWEPLVAAAKDGSIQGVLATSWEANDDQSVWTFTLREDVKFHDGSDMTAEDVVWSVEYARDPQNASTGQDEMALVDDVVALDDHTVQFTLTGPTPLFLLVLESPSALPVVPADSMEPGTITVQVPPAGTGPFEFVEWVPADKLVVTRFDDYWAGTPCLEGVTFQLIAQTAARQNALRAGDVHLIERAGTEFAQRVNDGDIRDITVDAATLSGFRMFNLNVTSDVFSNPTARLAAIYGMDMKALLDEAFFGAGYLIDGAVPPGSPWEDVLLECCPRLEYDPDKTRELLAEIGYDNEEVTLIVERGQGEPIGESIERSMRNAGFNMNLVILESGVYDERQASGDFDITPNSEAWSGDGFFGLTRFLCEPGLPEISIANHGRWCNDEFDALMEASNSEADFEKRLELYGQARQMVYDAAINKYMGFQYTRYFAWGDTVRNFDHIGNGSYQSYLGGGIPYIWLDE